MTTATTHTNTAMDGGVVPATAAETPRLARLLSAAFADNPVSDWLFDGHQHNQHPGFFTAFLHWATAGGLVEQTGDGMGVAVWIDLTSRPDQQLLARFDTAVQAAVGPHQARWQTFDQQTVAAHPTQPHWWLAFLGVHPAHRGHGHAGRLLGSATGWLAGTPTYLEATSRRLIGFYTRHGYKTTQQIPIPGGPVLYGMWNPHPDTPYPNST